MTNRARVLRLKTALLLAALLTPRLAVTAPWLPVGDAQLREDVELLAAHGLIANLTTTWPIGAGQVSALNDAQKLCLQPAFVQLAAARVRAQVRSSSTRSVKLKLSDEPAVVRSFEASARNQADLSVAANFNTGRWDAHVQAGTQTRLDSREGARFAPDGSTASVVVGNWRLYGGWVDSWYGAGQITALSLSSNARPFPKIGFIRDNPEPFETPWLSWLGPWRVDSFVGLLDGERREPHTLFSSFRVAFNPLEGLELALARTSQFCGRGHECNPLKSTFNLTNSDNTLNISNDEAVIDVRYTRPVGSLVLSPYFQHMNDDTGPFTHSYSAHLFGMTVDGPWQDAGSRWRLLAEFADTRATLNTFDFGTRLPGLDYNNFQYLDGFRYRGRTIGASLDSDSKLLTLGARFSASSGLRMSVDLHHAQVSSAPLAALQAQPATAHFRNTVSAVPVKFNELDVSLSLPLPAPLPPGDISLGLRARDHRLESLGIGRVNAELGLGFFF